MADDSEVLARLKYYFNRCKPDVPIPALDPDNLYVDFDSMGLRGERATETLASTIELSDGPTVQLFTGFWGSGKTSELLRLIRDLQGRDFFVVYVDAAEMLDLNNPVAYPDVLIALGLAVEQAFAAATGPVSGWATRFAAEIRDLLLSSVTIAQLKGKSGAVEIGLELKSNPSFRSEILLAANKRPRQLLEQAGTFFADADRLVRDNGCAAGLVLVLDNLEKLAADDAVQKSARSMFLNHADALRAPAVPTIYTLPVPLVFSRAGPELGRIFDGEPQILPMVKCRDRETGDPFTTGRDAMREMLARRLDFAEVFADEASVDILVQACGGYTRDLLRMTRYSLQRAGRLPVELSDVRSAIAKVRRSYVFGYRTDDRPVLEYIGGHRPETIPADFLDQLGDVINGHFGLVYGNERNWYDLHPLVADILSEPYVAPPQPNDAEPD